MKKTYKKYGIGGIAQSTSSPMIAQGMQASLSAWGGSPNAVFKEGGKMTRGGYTKRYKSEDMFRIREKKTHERMATEGVGNFELPKDRSTRYLYALDEFDQNLVKDIKLKPNEHIFRYESEATKAGKFNPLVKINLDNQLVYFLTESGYEMDEIEFERKGEKAKFINISDKYRNGGETERGAAHIYIKMQNGKYDVYHGDDVTLQKKAKLLYSRTKVLEGDWDKIWQDIQSTKSGAVEKGAAHIYIMLSDGKYTVYHGDSVTLRKDATPLYSRENAPEGTWKKIWQDLRGAKFGEGGSVSQKVKIKDIPNLHIEESSFFDSADVSYKPQGSNVGRALGRVTNLRKNKYEAVQLVGRGVENKVGEYKTRKEALDSLLNSEIFDGSLSEVVSQLEKENKDEFGGGGFVGDVAGSDLTPTMMGGGMGGAQDAILKKGGQAQVQIENKDIQFNKNLYKGVLDDFDLDGLPNADDPNPLKKQDSRSIEQTKLSTALNNVIRVKDKMDVELDEFVGKLRKVAPNDSKIYGRTKTPYSILNKLVNSRLLDERRGLKDLVGTTVAFNDFSDLEKFKKRVEKGMFGRVTEFDDYYANPNDGYRAYHFIVDQNGTPIELQLKTDRMKQINVLSHDAYKNNTLDKDYMLYLTTIANEADKGNKSAQNQYEMIMKDKVAVKKKLSSQ